MNKNYELELYKLITEKDELGISYVDELGWINDTQFCVWVSNYFFKDFIDGMTEIFGYGLYDDGSFDGNIQADCVCIDLCEVLGNYDIDLESIFPKNKYWH